MVGPNIVNDMDVYKSKDYHIKTPMSESKMNHKFYFILKYIEQIDYWFANLKLFKTWALLSVVGTYQH